VATPVVMPLLIDENVPESVTNFFRDRGHRVRHVRDEFLPGTPDPVIAVAGDQLGAVVVTWNHRDFKKLAAKVPKGGAAGLKRLGRINFRCDESKGLLRVQQVIEHIESAYQLAQGKKDKRLLVEVTTTSVRVIT
jgi:predicted nuclease of predicted toxin-antitoxin system